MTNMENGDGMIAIINFINRAIIADTDAPAFVRPIFDNRKAEDHHRARESRREYVTV